MKDFKKEVKKAAKEQREKNPKLKQLYEETKEYFKEGSPRIRKEQREEMLAIIREQYENIKLILKTYIDLKEEYYIILSLWIIGTYLHEQFESFPYLFFNAMRGSGKSRTLRLACKLSKDGNVMASPTEAVLFRVNGTLGIDEFEGVASKDKSAIRELLNGAYKRGIKIIRMKRKRTLNGEELVPEEFEPYRPVIMANINGMEEVLEDRCITLILEKSDNPKKTRLIEDFNSNLLIKYILENLNKCRVCSVELHRNNYTALNTAWNFYIDNRGDEQYFTHLTYTTNSTHSTHSTHETIKQDKLFNKIYESNIIGRNLELFLPLFFIASMIDEKILDETIEIAVKMTSEKKHEQEIESLDVMLIDFISKQEEGLIYIPAKDLVRNFREFSDTREEDINTKWFGLGLKRLNLYIDKKRKGRGVEYLLNVTKAKEKIKMFKSEEEINTTIKQMEVIK